MVMYHEVAGREEGVRPSLSGTTYRASQTQYNLNLNPLSFAGPAGCPFLSSDGGL